MSHLTLLFVAVGLSMDAFAVSVASGHSCQKAHVPHALRLAFLFGAFQAVMPVLGWLAGYGLQSIICSIDHWIAFGLLAAIGGKMIWESTLLESPDDPPARSGPTEGLIVLLLLALATSIDALAVGLSLSCLQSEIILPALLIGATTFVICFAGVPIGKRFGHLFESKVELIGGAILVGIGVKILIEHLWGGA